MKLWICVIIMCVALGCADGVSDCGLACLRLAQCQTSDVATDLVVVSIDPSECSNVECARETTECILAAPDCAHVLACRWPGNTGLDVFSSEEIESGAI